MLSYLENINDRRIYASALQRRLSLTNNETYEIIEKLLDIEFLVRRYQIKINDTFYPDEYRSFIDVPSNIYLEEEDEYLKVDLKNHLFVFYRVNFYE